MCKDRRGRRRAPEQDEALRRRNARLIEAGRRPTSPKRFHLPAYQLHTFERLNIGERSLLMEAAIDELLAGRWRLGDDDQDE